MICQLMYIPVNQFMFLNRDSKLFFLTVHLTELTNVVWSSERLCIYGFMALYKYFIIIIIIIIIY